MTADERRQQLAEYLARRGFSDLSVLVTELGVSESTVRRDLSAMEEEGIVRRTHGGAVFVSDRFSVLNYASREATAAIEKQAIGKAAAQLVDDGETVLLDGGTTTFQVARHLMSRSLQVVTNSLPIANLLGSCPNIELIFVGGYIYPRTGVALGTIAHQSLASLHVSKAFLAVAGVTEEALYNAKVLMVDTQRQMVQSSDEVIVVVDASKFGKRSLAQMSGWDIVDRVVSDVGLDAKWRRFVQDVGAELILADPGEAGGRGTGLGDGVVSGRASRRRPAEQGAE